MVLVTSKVLPWLLVALALLVSGCSQSGSTQPRSSTGNQQQATQPEESDPALAILTPGDPPSFESVGDYAQSGVLSTRNGCVALTLDSGEELLLYAPYGSEVRGGSPRIQLGIEEYDLGEEVELVGQAQDVWQAIGASKPTAWRQCVGGPRDHEVMFVVGTK